MQMTDLSPPVAEANMEERLLSVKRCGGKSYLYFLAAVASIGGFLFGYDTGVVSGAMELIRHQWLLDDVQHESLVSSTTGFAAIGAICSGTFNRKFGRKPVLIGASIVFTVAAIIMALSRNFGELLAGRCIVGVAVGLASSTVPMYISELAPPSVRGLLVSINNSCIVIGQVSAAIVDGILSADTRTGWRWMLGLGGVPSAIQFFGLLILPESPRWLLSRGRETEARATLRRLREGAADLDSVVETELDEIRHTMALARGGTHGSSTAKPAAVQPEPGSAVASSSAATVATEAAEPTSPAAVVPVVVESSGDAAVTLADLWAVRRQLTLGVGMLMLQQLIGINTIM